MIIGTMRTEEARVFDGQEGYHTFHDETGGAYGSFEVFWDDGDTSPWSDEPRNFDTDGDPVRPGWYWWACLPGYMPDGDPCGPFATSIGARADADEHWLD